MAEWLRAEEVLDEKKHSVRSQEEAEALLVEFIVRPLPVLTEEASKQPWTTRDIDSVCRDFLRRAAIDVGSASDTRLTDHGEIRPDVWNRIEQSDEWKRSRRLLRKVADAQAAADAAPAHDRSKETEKIAPGDAPDFASKRGRHDAVASYVKHWTTNEWSCSEASLARTANVHPADLSKWKKSRLSSKSDKRARIERVLKNNERPTPKARPESGA